MLLLLLVLDLFPHLLFAQCLFSLLLLQLLLLHLLLHLELLVLLLLQGLALALCFGLLLLLLLLHLQLLLGLLLKLALGLLLLFALLRLAPLPVSLGAGGVVGHRAHLLHDAGAAHGLARGRRAGLQRGRRAHVGAALALPALPWGVARACAHEGVVARSLGHKLHLRARQWLWRLRLSLEARSARGSTARRVLRPHRLAPL